MSRLPIPGQDDDVWGAILNDYLGVSLAPGGTVNPGVIGTAQLQNNCVTNAQLDSSTQSIIASVASKYVKPAGGIPSSDLSSAVQTSLSSANNALPASGGTMTGKLIVPSFQVTGGSPSSGEILTADSSGNATWAVPPSAPVSSVAGKTGAVTLVEGDVANLTTDLSAKYVKPGGGIPSTDMTSAVQTALGDATSAVQSVNGHIGNSVTVTAGDVGGLLATNNLSDVSSAGASRQNIHVPDLLPAACVAASNVASLSGLNTYDGYTLTAGDQVLLIAQSTASQNGPWVAASGAWTRPTDFATGNSVKARSIAIIQGTTYGGSTYLLQTNSSITIDTTSQTWVSQLPSSVANASSLWIDPRSYGAVFDGVTDDTTAINNAIAAAQTANGVVVLPPGKTALVTSLTYNAGNWSMVGGGKTSSILRQKSGTATPILASTGSGWPYFRVRFADFGLDATVNTASNTGGLFMQGSSNSLAQRLWIHACNNYGIKLMGGGAGTSGDAMYCQIDQCDIISTGTGGACIQLSPQTSPAAGSHPDRARITNNFFTNLYTHNTTGVLIDVPPTVALASNADGVLVSGNNMQGIAVPFDVCTQQGLFIGNTTECTGAGQTMNVYVRQGPANYPSNNNTFIANEYATQGVALNFTFNDSGVGTNRYEWNLGSSNIQVGASINTLLTDRIGVFGSGGNTIISVLNLLKSTAVTRSIPHFGMVPMPGTPTIQTGQAKGIFVDNNNAVGLYGIGGANGGVRAWLDNGANAVAGNVLDDGNGNFLNASGQKVGVTKIFDSTAGSTVANFNITSIPAGFGSLVVVCHLASDRAAAASDVVNLQINGDAGANYDYEYTTWHGGTAGSNGSAAAATAAIAGRCTATGTGPANTFSGLRLELPSYDDTTNNKTYFGTIHYKDGTGGVNINSGTCGGDWRSTAAITQITLTPNTGPHFIAGSRVIVYGMP